MSRKVVILRPEPGGSETAARARVAGLEPVVAPLFVLRALQWEPPEAAGFDAVLLTSANAARCGGPALTRFFQLPCFAVGDASAAAARQAGFADVETGSADAVAALALIARSHLTRVLHLCGRDHVAAEAPGLTVERRLVYAADAVERLPAAAERAIAQGTLTLLHSPRAAARFAALVRDRKGVRIAAISPAAAEAAGEGWALRAVAAAPRDQALLELAVKLCQTASPDEAERDGPENGL